MPPRVEVLEGAQSPELCEVCSEPYPILTTLAFRRGKQRRVCLNCLAVAIQRETGFKMTAVLNRMLEARATAPLVAQAYKLAARRLREEAMIDA